MYGTFDEPLFLAKDVAEWIDFGKTSQGYYDISAMLRKIDEEEKIKKSSTILNRSTWFLTEDGLYEVLMQSRKPIEEGKLVYTLYISGQKRDAWLRRNYRI